MPRGGPDGGDGGRGGDVVLVCDAQRRDLSSLGRSRHFRAGRGRARQGQAPARRARGGPGDRGAARNRRAGLDGSETELLEDGQRVVVARGGSGGHGNKRFATSTRQAPRFAEQGLEGESGEIELRLKLLADVGLVGLPNAGKSSLLARLTRADPKVADYPFTTLEPNLGTIELDDRQAGARRHPRPDRGRRRGRRPRPRVPRPPGALPPAGPPGRGRAGRGDPESNYEAVRGELAGYGSGLDELPEIIALSKIDLIPDEEAERLVAEWRERLGSECRRGARDLAATGAGLDELVRAIFARAAR